MELDRIYNMDCLKGLRDIESGSIQCIIMDPPYELKSHGEKKPSAFGRKGRDYHKQIDHLQNGIGEEVMKECMRVMEHPNMYIFCSKYQLPQLLSFATCNKLSFDLLTWHKTNPTPTCNNKYLSDTEYIVFMRKGANLYGSYETKRKYFITKTNTEDKRLYGHPTPKPLEIIKTLITNSSLVGDTILDPFMGSGTTAVACIKEKRHFVGFELNKEYYDKACKRIKEEQAQLSLF